jgi:hypothetical protein
MPDGSFDELDVDPITHMESEYGIFVSDAGKDIDKKQKIEGLAQAAVQNGLPLSAAIAMYDSDSLSQIKDKIIQAEKAQEELKKAQDQAMQQQEQAKIQVQQQAIQQASLDKEKDRQLQIEVALIGAEATDKNSQANLEKMMQDFQIKQQELALKERDLDIKANSQIKE